MMRDFKFRAWNKPLKKMDYSGQNAITFDGKIYYGNADITGFFDNIMQYTGHKDKNGKEIYESDIVKVIDDPVFGMDEFVGKVEYDECGFWIINNKKQMGCSVFQEIAELEVIGNIHEHAHLLEGVKTMDCNLKECEWNVGGNCCPESEEMYNNIIPNTKACKYYHDSETELKQLKNEVTEDIYKIFKEANISHLPNEIFSTINPKVLESYREEMMRLYNEKPEFNPFDNILLLAKYHDEMVELYNNNQEFNDLENLIKEVNEYGLDYVKNKWKNRKR